MTRSSDGFPVENPKEAGGFDRMDQRAQMTDRIAHLEKCLAAARNELTEERNTAKRFRSRLSIIEMGIDEAVDSARFGRAEDAADFRAIVAEMDDREIEAGMDAGAEPRDYIAELREANIRLQAAATNEKILHMVIVDHGHERVSSMRRISDLLVANSRYLERARAARLLLRRCREVLTSQTVAEEIDVELAQRISQ